MQTYVFNHCEILVNITQTSGLGLGSGLRFLVKVRVKVKVRVRIVFRIKVMLPLLKQWRGGRGGYSSIWECVRVRVLMCLCVYILNTFYYLS